MNVKKNWGEVETQEEEEVSPNVSTGTVMCLRNSEKQEVQMSSPGL